MTAVRASGKGQMSFDMAFAIVIVLLIFMMLVNHSNTSSAASSKTARLAALASSAESAAGNLRALYNSLAYAPQGAKADYILEMRGGSTVENDYAVDYVATLGNTVKLTLTREDGTTESIQRGLGFGFSGCSDIQAHPGDRIKMTGCTAPQSSLSCDTCMKLP